MTVLLNRRCWLIPGGRELSESKDDRTRSGSSGENRGLAVMRLRPRHLTKLCPEEGDLAVMRRWGVSRCDAVEMASVSSELTKLLVEDPVPPADPRTLVGWICQRRHPVQENRLEEAIAIATRAELVHRKDDAWPHGLADQLIEMLDCVVTHQQREQAVVFPMLVRGVDALPDLTVDAMIAAHEDLMARWRGLDQLTGGFRAPPHACAAWRLLYVLCYKLYVDTREQVDLENRMLLAGRRRGIRNDTEAPVVHAQRRQSRPRLEDGHEAQRIAPSFSEGPGPCSRNSFPSSSPLRP